jgi:hypothetical protein
MEAEVSLSCSQESFTGLYPEPDQFSPYHPILLFKTYLNPLKTKYVLSSIWEFSSYLTGNTLRLNYKVQPVNAV